jgi:uncharacterized repeat protein (TIGR03803 family)
VLNLNPTKKSCFIVAFCCAVAILSSAQSFTKLFDFSGSDGRVPYGTLVQGTDGNFYGTTSSGGGNCTILNPPGCGTIFKITPQGALTTIYTFCSVYVNLQCLDGETPIAGLILGTDGNFYGTARGGTGYVGTIYRFSPQGVLTTLYNFSGNDGNGPGRLIQGIDGSFYGTTSSGGSSRTTGNCGQAGCGTVFKIAQDGTFTTLHNFDSNDGSLITAGLVQGADGDLYGTATEGGSSNCQYGCGSIYKISTSGTFTTLYSFCTSLPCTDGSYPQSGLVLATDGNFYGTTETGGTGAGTVFKVTPNGSLTTLYTFSYSTGFSPLGTLIQASDGNFYGTTYGGGSGGYGTVFRITPSGRLTTLHCFDGTDGSLLDYGGVVQGVDGKFYGTTPSGGASDNGVVFSLTVDFNLILSVSNMGNGTITSSDGSINCNAACTAQYESGDVVTLTATPAQGWSFSNWSGCDTVQANVCTVTMENSRNVTATYTATYSMSVAVTGSGTVTSADGFINCGTACSHMYLNLTVVTLTATAAQGWVLTNWTGCDTVRGNVCTVSMWMARNASATFRRTYGVTVLTNGSGTVISGDGYINCGIACFHDYPSGTTLALTAMPAVGSTVGSWSGCTSTHGNVCTVTINSATTVSVTFSPVTVSFGSLTFSPTPARYGIVTVGTLNLAMSAPQGGVTLRLSSSQPRIVTVPSIIYVPGGATVIRFGLQVISPRPVGVTITATDTHSSVVGMLSVVPVHNTSPAPGSSTKAMSPASPTTRPAESLRPTVPASTSEAPGWLLQRLPTVENGGLMAAFR